VSRELPQGADTRLAQGPGEEDRGGPGRQLPTWLILASLFALALAIAFSIKALNDYVGVRSESRVLMMDLEDDATEQHLALHESFLNVEAASEIREVTTNKSQKIRGLISELERMNPGSAEVSGIREAFDAYEAAGEDLLPLVEAGSFQEAMVLDHERMHLAFEELDERIDAAYTAFEGSARRAALIVDWGIYATALLGAAVLALAFQRYRRSEARSRHQALHDPLTGLPNRNLFSDRIRHALERARRSGKVVAVLFMDLDNFKYINDSLGHETGDELLVKVASRIERILRVGDTVARFGGDEFIVLLEDIAGVEDATRVAERIASELRDPLVLVGQDLSVGASIGIAVRRPAEVVGDGNLLRDADAAMYAAKQDGKATYRVFDPSMNKDARVRLRLENELRAALKSGEFALHYQPKVELKTGRIVGFEALVRWHHPRRNLVDPDHFIPIAEEIGLISPIGQWVLERACRQAKGWHEAHPDLPPLTIAVNLSPSQFRNPDLVEEVEEVLRETGLDPSALELEITEGVAMEDAPSTLTTLYKLKGLGAKLSIDDFGTGYSSLSYLKRFPVDYLKLDRSITEGLDQDPRNNAVASAVIALAHNLGQQVIAEGVETEEQLGRLGLLGCDIGQGHLFAEPVPNEDALALFKETLKGKPPPWATRRRGPG
jgi:diguanylate cyclase (GGDEF)-like protein